MMSRPIFSLLIANYNNAQFFEELVASVQEQTYRDFEVIFLDDGSTDGSLRIFERLADTYENYRIFSNDENRGSAYTKRRCIQLSTGAICGFLDADDLLAPDAIEKMVEIHEKKPNVSLVYSNFSMFKKSLSDAYKYTYPDLIPDNLVLLVGMTPNHFSTFKKEHYQLTSGINPNVMPAEDRDLVLKLEEVGQVFHLKDYLYYYRLSDRSISNNDNYYKADYWAWVVRFDACDRRSLDKPSTYSEIMRIRNQCISAKKKHDLSMIQMLMAGLSKAYRYIK